MMLAAFNVFCLLVLAFNVVSLAYFIFAWKRARRWDDLMQRIRASSTILLIVSIVIASAALIGNVSATFRFSYFQLANFWVLVLCVALYGSIIFGCCREDIKGREEIVLLALIVYCGCTLSSVCSVYSMYPLGVDLQATCYIADALSIIIQFIMAVLLWRYVSLIGNIGSRISEAFAKAFVLITVVEGILLFGTSLSFFVDVDSCLAGLMLGLNPEKVRTDFGAAYSVLVSASYCVISLLIILGCLCSRVAANERIFIVLLVFVMPAAIIAFGVFDELTALMLLIGIAELGCYQGIVLRRSKDIQYHLAQVEMAQAIQQDLLPQEYPNDGRCRIAAHLWPAKEVSSDFYDFYRTDDDHLYITIASVSGADVPAAMLMAKTRALTREYEKFNLAPDEILFRVNKSLYQSSQDHLSVSVWIGRVSFQNGNIVYANAGHTPPVALRRGVGACFLNDVADSAIGLSGEAQYRSCVMLLKQDDRLLLITEKIANAQNSHKEHYGEKRLLDFVASVKDCDEHAVLEALYEDVMSFGNREQEGSIAALCATFCGKPENAVNDYAEESFCADCSALDDVIEFIDNACVWMNYPENHRFKLQLCVEELFINVCNYAYVDSPKQGKIRIAVIALDKEIRILFADSGIPFNPLSKEAPNFKERAKMRTVGGLGIYLVRKNMDDVLYEYSEGENRLTIVKKLD